MSRNLTYNDDNRNEIPTDTIKSSATKGIINNHWNDGVTPLIKAKRHKTTMPKKRLIKADIAVENTNKYFGRLIFLIKSPRATTDDTPRLVDSAKKFHRMTPVNKYTGKCSTPLPNGIIYTNITYKTVNKNSGLSNDHA